MKYLALLSTITILSFFACKSGPGTNVANEPKVVLKAFFERLANKDFKGAEELATSESKSVMSIFKLGLEMAEKMDKSNPEYKDPTDEMKNVEIGEPIIKGEEALVPFVNKKTGSKSEFPLKKENGLWKVNLSLSALQTMAKKENGEVLDKMDTTQFKEGIKKMDSIMKNVDVEKLKSLQKQLENLSK